MSWDFEQMFTPPSSKSPWTALTHGSTDKWAKGAEAWGPVIMNVVNKIPVVGWALGGVGGAMGMGGRGTGYIGSDYGDANWGTTIGGAASGAMGSFTPGGYASAIGSSGAGIKQAISGESAYGPNDTGENPPANEYNSSWYGGVASGLGNVAGGVGSMYGGQWGGMGGSMLGGRLGIFDQAGGDYGARFSRAPSQGEISGMAMGAIMGQANRNRQKQAQGNIDFGNNNQRPLFTSY